MSSYQRISDRQRQIAVHELEGFHERGFINDVELVSRLESVHDATTAGEIALCLDDLREGRRGSGELRVTTHEREAAERRLEIHLEDGQLEESEWERRRNLVESASTAAEIREALTELPPLKPRPERRGERLASHAERESALTRLLVAKEEGRLESDEYDRRAAIVSNARTRNEIHSAFRGIPQHRLGQPHVTVKDAGHVAKNVGHVVTRTGVALARALVIVGWVSICALIVLVWVISRVQATVPVVLIALISVVSIALLWMPGLMPDRRRD